MNSEELVQMHVLAVVLSKVIVPHDLAKVIDALGCVGFPPLTSDEADVASAFSDALCDVAPEALAFTTRGGL